KAVGLHRANVGGIESPVGIGKVPYRCTEPALYVASGAGDLVNRDARRFVREQDVALRVRAEREAGTMHFRDLIPAQRTERLEVGRLELDSRLEGLDNASELRVGQVLEQEAHRGERIVEDRRAGGKQDAVLGE